MNDYNAEEVLWGKAGNEEDGLDELLAMLRALPEQVKILDLEKYQAMRTSADVLQRLISEMGERSEVSLHFESLFNLGAVRAEISDLTVNDCVAFSRLLLAVDQFEVYPLTNGKLRVSFTFQSVLKTLA